MCHLRMGGAMSNVVKWLFVAWYAYSIVFTVSRVGKPVKPTTAGVAAASVCVLGVLMAGVIIFWPTS